MTRQTYIPVERPWTWDTGTAQERADMIRRHASDPRPLSRDAIKNLFLLTDAGLDEIISGDVWRPGYQRTPGA